MATTVTDRFGTPLDPTTVSSGLNGWTPAFALVSSGERRFLQLVEWTGGTGAEPDGAGSYLSTSGLVDDTGDATDIRGAAGASGAGSGDMLAAQNLADVSDAATAFDNIKQVADTGYSGVVEIGDTGETRTGTSKALVPSLYGLAFYAEQLGHLRGLQTQTAAYTPVITDNGKNVEIDSSSSRQVTIPTDASVAFLTGDWFLVTRIGSGSVTVKGDVGVTVNGVSAGTVTLTAQYASVLVYKRGTNEWIVPNKTAS